MSVKFDTDALNRLIIRHGLSGKKDLPSFLGSDKNGNPIVKYDAVISWFRTKNPTQPSDKAIAALCDKFGVKKGYFYGDFETEYLPPQKESQKIPVLEMVAGAGSEGDFDHELKTIGEIITPHGFIEPFNQKYTRIIQCYGDSMMPEYNDGDYCLVDMIGDRINFARRPGIYIVRIGNIIHIKRVDFLPRGAIRLISINEKYGSFVVGGDDSQDNYEIIALVRGKISIKIENGLKFTDQGL